LTKLRRISVEKAMQRETKTWKRSSELIALTIDAPRISVGTANNYSSMGCREGPLEIASSIEAIVLSTNASKLRNANQHDTIKRPPLPTRETLPYGGPSRHLCIQPRNQTINASLNSHYRVSVVRFCTQAVVAVDTSTPMQANHRETF
jgi:hypothetical protein